MSAVAMISGKLVGEPKTRDTRTGGKVTFFRLRVANGNTVEFWDVATFDDEARGELDSLPEHAPLTVTGEFHAEPWERDGKRGFNLKVTADVVLSLRTRKQRKAIPRATPYTTQL
jgi:single-stranded DNA-binding protein